MEQPILQVSDLSVDFNGHHILQHISFHANSHETIAIIGPNGAGKTTLFRALLGLIPYQGTITWRPNIVIGYVPQRLYIGNDLPLTTEEFFSCKTTDKKEMYRVLYAVGFQEKESSSKHHILKKQLGILSGGELQKILIAWALIGKPDILLFDEPTSGVDVSSEETIYTLLHKLQEQERFTIMLISHELQVVSRYATNVICLNKESVCFGPPNKVMDKATLQKLFGSDIGVYQHHHDD